MQTVIHEYHFDLGDPRQAVLYTALCDRMKAQGTDCFESWSLGGGSHFRGDLDGKTIALETTHLFSNQWNTAPIPDVSALGLRVFDWAQDYLHNPKIKRGHYLDLTDEMKAIRRDTKICGYCGKNYPPGTADGLEFCTACLDSPYLKEDDLFLLRLMPVELHFPERAPLTNEEKAALLPMYVERQTTGVDSRSVKQKIKVRQDVETMYQKAMANATKEHDGMIWLLDRGLSTDNVIYYDHTQKFSFGWRTPVSAAVKSGLLEVLAEFPFEYEIKSEAG